MRLLPIEVLFLLGISGVLMGCSERPRDTGSGGTEASSASAGVVALDTESEAIATNGFTGQAPTAAPGSASASLSYGATGGFTGKTQSSRSSEASEGETPIEVERNAFAGFGSDTTVADVTADPKTQLMYVLEADGTLRVLDTRSARPQLVRAFPLFPKALSQAQLLGRLELVDPNVALLPTQGEGFEGFAIFNPLEARGSQDVAWFDLSGLTASWPAGTLNSQGVDVGGRPLPVTQITGATLVGDVVYVCAANEDAEGDHPPGVVAALQLDLAGRRIKPMELIRTSAFNPTGLKRLGEVLLVTNSGSLGQSGASIDVIDLRTAQRSATIPFPEVLADGRIPDPFGPVVVSPDGRRGYVGSLNQARLYTLDLESLTFVDDVLVPSQSTRNSTRDLAISSDGATLYASNAGDRSLNLVSVSDTSEVTRVSGFSGGSGSDSGQLGGFVVQRDADTGDEAVLAVVTDLAPEERVQPDVSSTLDRVSLESTRAASK